MKRTPLRRRAPLRVKSKLRRSKRLERTASMAASECQRAVVAGRTCIVCGSDRRIDPAHLLSGGTAVGMCVLAACSFVGMSANEPDEGFFERRRDERPPPHVRAAVRFRKHAAAS